MTDRSVLVTGATGGLGAAVVASFVAEGWRVVAPVRGTLDAPGVDVLPGTELDDPAVIAAATADPDRPLRALVNLVGGFASGGRIHETPWADFDAQFQVNLRTTYLVTSAALPALLESARDGGGAAIVCTSSRAAQAPFPGAAGYIASKAAVLAFAQTVAVEYRDAGVRCNTIVPSVIDTPKNRAAQPNADATKWTRPEDIARVIRFFAGTGSAPTTGAAIPV